MERVNGRLKIFWGVDDGNITGSRRFHAMVGAVMIVHAAFAMLLAAAPRREGTLGKLRLSPSRRHYGKCRPQADSTPKPPIFGHARWRCARRCLKRANERHSTPIPAATTAASGFLLFATVNECPPTAHIANGSRRDCRVRYNTYGD